MYDLISSPPKIILIYLKNIFNLFLGSILFLNFFSSLFSVAFVTGMKTE